MAEQQLKLLVCITVIGCLLRSASCENKKKVLVKVPHVVKHIHYTHFEPVHVQKVHHQKKKHYHKHGKKVSVGDSGWESRSHEKPSALMTSYFAPQDSEDHLLDSYEYGRESFWDGGDSRQTKRRRQPNWGDSLEESSKWMNVEGPKWMNRGQGDYVEEWAMSDEELPELRGGLGYRGGKESLDNGSKKKGRKLSWRSNHEDGWKPITSDHGHWNDEIVARGKERANVENQYNHSGEITDSDYQEHRQTEERRHKKGNKKGEKKPKWSKQIQEGELISEQDVQRIIESLQREQYQQQQIPQQHQEYRFIQEQQQTTSQPNVQLQQHLTQQQQHLPQQQQHLPQQQQHLSQQQQHLPQQQQYLTQQQQHLPQQQQNLPQHHQYLPQQQQGQQTMHQPVYRAQNPIVLSPLPQMPQPQLSSWSLPIQQKKPTVFPEPQHWTSSQTQPLTTHSPKMVWSGLHLELPQTTMWHVQQHDVGSTSGLPVQVISSSHPKTISSSSPATQPQTLASNPLHHQVLPPAGWPMNYKSQSGVKQKWE